MLDLTSYFNWNVKQVFLSLNVKFNQDLQGV